MGHYPMHRQSSLATTMRHPEVAFQAQPHLPPPSSTRVTPGQGLVLHPPVLPSARGAGNVTHGRTASIPPTQARSTPRHAGPAAERSVVSYLREILEGTVGR